MRYVLPLGIFVLLAGLLWVGLGINPREIPSPLLGKPAPAFSLPELTEGGGNTSPADFRGKVWVLNVWASWCSACREEHEELLALARQSGVNLLGLNYKDEPVDAKAWLAQAGNPYARVAVDADGHAGINWGVYGVPESFVIDQQGVIRRKFTGPLTEETVAGELLPLLDKLRAEGG